MPTISTLTVDVHANTSRFRTAMRGVALGLAGLAAGAVVAVKNASDLNESINKTGEVFGKQTPEILKWSKASAEAFGTSQKDALDAASNFGLFAQAADQSGKEVTKFSTEMVELAGDLASFFNVPVAQALEDIRSGLSGQSEPLRKYGVFLTENAVKAEAMRLGIVGANEELTEGQKVLARQSLILEQTGKAQGDFARTSDSLANQQRILGAEFENLLAHVGRLLLPLGVTLLTAVLDFVEVIQAKVVPAIQDWWKQIGPVASALGKDLVDAISTAWEWLLKVWEAVKPVAVAFGRELAEALSQTWHVIRDKVWPALKDLFEALQPVFRIIGQVAAVVIKLALEALPVVAEALGVVIRILEKVVEAFTAVINFVREKFVEPIVGAIQRVIEWIQRVVEWVAEKFGAAWENVKGPVIDTIMAIVDAVQTLIGWIKTAIGWLIELGNQTPAPRTATGIPAAVPHVNPPQAQMGGFVARSGLAVIHRGEHIIPRGEGGDIILQVDGREIGRVARNEINRNASRNATSGLRS